MAKTFLKNKVEWLSLSYFKILKWELLKEYGIGTDTASSASITKEKAQKQTNVYMETWYTIKMALIITKERKYY